MSQEYLETIEKTNNKQTLSDRLKEIMQERNLRQVDILNLCKPYCELYNTYLGRSHLSQYVKGTILPRKDKIMVLALALDVNEAWLMGYDVPAGKAEDKDSLVLSTITSKEVSLLLAYRNHPEMQNVVDKILDLPNNEE